MIKTILKSYNLSLNDYNSSEKSKHWDFFYKNKFKKISLHKLKNFRDNGLSDGMDNARLAETKKYNQIRLNQIENFLKRDKKSLKHYKNLLPKKNIGKSKFYVKHHNSFIDFIFCENFFSFLLLEKYAFKKKVENIIEIGGGFGSLARIISSKRNVKYFLIDLPETNLLSTYYLHKNFPQKKIFTYSDCKSDFISSKDVEKYDFIILPPWINFKDIKFQIFINMRSMMEMNFKIIKKYFDLIHSTADKEALFLNNNRYHKNTVGADIMLHKYPYDDKWKVIFSKVSFGQNKLHTLITKRLSKKGDIKIELKKIRQLAKNHTPFFSKLSPFFYI